MLLIVTVATAVLFALSVKDASRRRACPVVKGVRPYAGVLLLSTTVGVAVLLAATGLFWVLAAPAALLAVVVGVNVAARGIWALTDLIGV